MEKNGEIEHVELKIEKASVVLFFHFQFSIP